MRLAKCPGCGHMIDLDIITALKNDTVVGCGLKEGIYESCEDCAEEYNTEGCAIVREANDITKTTIADLRGDNSDE